MNNELHEKLKQLRLSGMISSLDIRLQEARANRLDFPEFLELLIQDEMTVRQERKIARMLKKAAFVFVSTQPRSQKLDITLKSHSHMGSSSSTTRL